MLRCMRDHTIIFIDAHHQTEQMLNQESGSAEYGPGDPIDSCDSELENNELVVATYNYS